MNSETVCWYNKFGYCKFGDKCFRKHENRICENVQCPIWDCPLRHPKNCRYFQEFHYCKFGTFCKFNHKIEESRIAKKELIDLQKEIKSLEDKIKHMEIEIESKTKVGNSYPCCNNEYNDNTEMLYIAFFNRMK